MCIYILEFEVTFDQEQKIPNVTATCSSHLLSDRFIEANLILLKPEPRAAHTITITSPRISNYISNTLSVPCTVIMGNDR